MGVLKGFKMLALYSSRLPVSEFNLNVLILTYGDNQITHTWWSAWGSASLRVNY